MENCLYGNCCSFAHNEDEIQCELLHKLEKNNDFFMTKFKTIWCPFGNIKHNKSTCVYAHNW